MCCTTKSTSKSALICLAMSMNLRWIMLISSSQQVINSKYMLMDVTAVVHTADMPSWSLIIHILSSSLAAETSTSWSERERNPGRQKGACQDGPAVKQRDTFHQIFDLAGVSLCANPTVCQHWSPVKRNRGMQWQWMVQHAAFVRPLSQTN